MEWGRPTFWGPDREGRFLAAREHIPCGEVVAGTWAAGRVPRRKSDRGGPAEQRERDRAAAVGALQEAIPSHRCRSATNTDGDGEADDGRE